MHVNQAWSRRKFIAGIAGAGAAVALDPLSAFAVNKVDPAVAAIVAKTIGIDTHNHMDVPFNATEFASKQYELAAEMKTSGLTAICMTFCVDRPNLTKTGEAYERFLISLDEMDQLLKDNKLTRALNYADLKNARKQNKPVVIQSVEGGHFIEGKLERISIGYQRGLRHLGLLHDNQSPFPLGDIYTDAPKYNGLTEMGVSVIKECNRLGILVDLAHCSNDAVKQALKISTKPIIISHTGLNTQLGNNERMANMMRPRLISKEQAKLVAGAGGVIGVWTHLADTPADYAKNIRAMVEAAGVEHVCIGTDSKMATATNSTDKFGKQTNQSWDNDKDGFLYVVVDALLKNGFTENDILKITGENYCRVFDAATKV